MKFLVNGKRISKKALGDILGRECLDRMIREAKEAHLEDPLEEISWHTGIGMVVIEIE